MMGKEAHYVARMEDRVGAGSNSIVSYECFPGVERSAERECAEAARLQREGQAGYRRVLQTYPWDAGSRVDKPGAVSSRHRGRAGSEFSRTDAARKRSATVAAKYRVATLA